LGDLVFCLSFAAGDIDVVANLTCADFDLGVALGAFAGFVVDFVPDCVNSVGTGPVNASALV
jgi:hypothetical protein